MKIARLLFCVLLAAFVCGLGCTSTRPDPLAGWTFHAFEGFEMPPYGHNHYHNPQAISDDYDAYLKQNGFFTVGALTGLYEDGTGQHAARFQAGKDGTYWDCILIYDKDNKRIKVIKHIDGHYAC
jgi:hypothetical protein